MIVLAILLILLLISAAVAVEKYVACEHFEAQCNALSLERDQQQQRAEQLAKELHQVNERLTALTPPKDENTGHFVTTRELRKATPETYRNVFDLDLNGQRVLDHLEFTFAKKSAYVRGGQDAERESCFRAGQAHVIGFIFNQINKANNPQLYKEQDHD